MKIVQITNGEIHLKSVYPRNIRREANKITFKNIEIKQGTGDDVKLSGGIPIITLDDVNCYLLVALTEK